MHRKTRNSHDKGSDQTGFFLMLYCDNQCIFCLDLSRHFENEAWHQDINVCANISYFFTQQIARWMYCNTLSGKIVRHPSWCIGQLASLQSKVETEWRNWVPKSHGVYMAQRIISLWVRIVLHEEKWETSFISAIYIKLPKMKPFTFKAFQIWRY